MHLELVELLRCPVPHAPGVLVASADVIANRYVSEGLLGCPECYAEYVIRGGVTRFVSGDSLSDRRESLGSAANSEQEANAANSAQAANGARAVNAANSEQAANAANGARAANHSLAAMRLAAQLALSTGRSVFALVGYDVMTMVAMREIVAARVLLLNPSQFDAAAFASQQLQSVPLVAPVGVISCGEVLPLVPARFDGLAVHAAHALPGLLEQAAAALRIGGRLVAPVQASIPVGMRELVRDEHVWVAERESVASAPISLRRR